MQGTTTGEVIKLDKMYSFCFLKENVLKVAFELGLEGGSGFPRVQLVS